MTALAPGYTRVSMKPCSFVWSWSFGVIGCQTLRVPA